MPSTAPLRLALRLNAGFSTISALVLFAAHGELASAMGVDARILIGVGAGLAAFAGHLVFTASRSEIAKLRAESLQHSCADFAWVAAVCRCHRRGLADTLRKRHSGWCRGPCTGPRCRPGSIASAFGRPIEDRNGLTRLGSTRNGAILGSVARLLLLIASILLSIVFLEFGLTAAYVGIGHFGPLEVVPEWNSPFIFRPKPGIGTQCRIDAARSRGRDSEASEDVSNPLLR